MVARTDIGWSEMHTFVTVCAAAGMSVKQTAETRRISPWTIRQYRREAILMKGASNMCQVVAMAIREGIIN